MAHILIFWFDGTWNGMDDPHGTNIRKLYRGSRHPSQTSFYFSGPGNETESNKFQELLGGAFGLGSWDIRDKAFSVLQQKYRPGMRIVVGGFSRGAGVARMFCNKIFQEGVCGHSPEVDVLACFDTVGAYLPYPPFQQGLFHNLTVAPCVKRAYHAVALHEDRKTFTPNLMNYRDGIIEMWFRGVHGSVGGGLKRTGNSDVALQWMIDMLTLEGVHVNVATNPDPTEEFELAPGKLYRRAERRVGVKQNGRWSRSRQPFMHPTVMAA